MKLQFLVVEVCSVWFSITLRCCSLLARMWMRYPWLLMCSALLMRSENLFESFGWPSPLSRCSLSMLGSLDTLESIVWEILFLCRRSLLVCVDTPFFFGFGEVYVLMSWSICLFVSFLVFLPLLLLLWTILPCCIISLVPVFNRKPFLKKKNNKTQKLKSIL